MVNAHDGFLDVEEKRQRHDYSVARLLASYVTAPHMKKGAKFSLVFPWEEAPRIALTPEQIAHLSAQIDRAAAGANWTPVQSFTDITASA